MLCWTYFSLSGIDSVRGCLFGDGSEDGEGPNEVDELKLVVLVVLAREEHVHDAFSNGIQNNLKQNVVKVILEKCSSLLGQLKDKTIYVGYFVKLFIKNNF